MQRGGGVRSWGPVAHRCCGGSLPDGCAPPCSPASSRRSGRRGRGRPAPLPIRARPCAHPPRIPTRRSRRPRRLASRRLSQALPPSFNPGRRRGTSRPRVSLALGSTTRRSGGTRKPRRTRKPRSSLSSFPLFPPRGSGRESPLPLPSSSSRADGCRPRLPSQWRSSSCSAPASWPGRRVRRRDEARDGRADPDRDHARSSCGRTC